jgi:hypothetical protein
MMAMTQLVAPSGPSPKTSASPLSIVILLMQIESGVSQCI